LAEQTGDKMGVRRKRKWGRAVESFIKYDLPAVVEGVLVDRKVRSGDWTVAEGDGEFPLEERAVSDSLVGRRKRVVDGGTRAWFVSEDDSIRSGDNLIIIASFDTSRPPCDTDSVVNDTSIERCDGLLGSRKQRRESLGRSHVVECYECQSPNSLY